MHFTREIEMKKPVSDWLVSQGLSVKAEFSVPWGICDLVGLSFNKNHIRIRKKHNQNKTLGPASRIRLFQNLPDVKSGKSITLKRLKREFSDYFIYSDLETEIQYLAKGNFIQSPRKNSYQRLDGWMPLHKRIVAVELKLNRIEEVLFQASSHLLFATESYVALPNPVAERVMNSRKKDDFSSIGVGILSVTNTQCKILLKTKRSDAFVDQILQLHCAERFWREYIKDNST